MPARPGFVRQGGFDRRLILGGASFSGHERNRLFLNLGGQAFEDISGISGLDAEADGRSFALFDFDRDGWQDLVTVNANAPLVELFRNRIADDPGRAASRNRTLTLRFVGGNRSARAAANLSNRDGIGVRVEVRVGGQVLHREQRAGEGFAAQNSAAMVIGVGPAASVDRLRVRWPSGITRELREVATSQLVSVYEVPEHSPTGESFVLEKLPSSVREAFAARRSLELPRRVFPLHESSSRADKPRLVLYTTMATWCATCLGELPHWARLTELFSPAELEIRAVPVDERDTAEKLGRYIARHKPAYSMLSGLRAEDVASVNASVFAELGKAGLPASFLTDQAGRILDSGWGSPTVSVIRRLLADAASAQSNHPVDVVRLPASSSIMAPK